MKVRCCPSTVPESGNSLANQLAIVSRLIAGGLETQIYIVSQGGYDTHSNQVADESATETLNLFQKKEWTLFPNKESILNQEKSSILVQGRKQIVILLNLWIVFQVIRVRLMALIILFAAEGPTLLRSSSTSLW